ncbi:LOW QUALITY PROTEIN: tyrosine-protein phosphatase non-receptor type 23-like [Babylonia areolata]|uniref:LOW QUALITY PROTEIN: tyrosine-protein phosphatase non-receptor type 23-like n=1 Tax=Babylonia areolata TaxID=304850 RepID=UPI003FD4F13F
MEAVPRLPMLAFELKHSPEYVDFGPTLKKYIRDHYGEDPAGYNKNFSDLDQLRQNAIHVTRDFVGCATLKRYYAQLHLMNGRFPMGEGGEAAITFTWEDNQTGRDHIIADIKFEQACILYNIGALHSNLGAIDTRQNAEGMKVSCTHFQCAAWAFEHLRDHFGSSSMSTDMAHEYLTFHVNVMLAQAQECILEKSMIDSRKNTITAKVSAQVVDFYRLSVKNLDQCNSEQIINSRSYKDWKKRIELKIAFYQCITHYYMGKQSEEQQKWGERLAYFQAAQDKLNESVKLAKNEVPEMQEALRFAQDVVGGKLQSAQKDNDFIYHEKIPPLDSLPEVKGAPLVKGIPFDPADPEISGIDIFQKLVPMEAHEASSVYSEEKAKLLRAVMENIETSNVELEQFMTSLQIDPSTFEQLPDRLPQELLEKCAAMSVRTNAIKDLVDAMSGVSGLATEAEMSIKEIQDMIAEDTQKSEDFEKQFGKKMPSSVLPGLAKDCEGHADKHAQGSQLNANLHTAMNAHITNLKLLALPPDQLQAQLPPAQPQRSVEDEEVMTEMRRLLGKVEEMKVQRAKLEKQFRDDIQKDDITTVLMAADSIKDSVYKDQLKKHDTLIGYIGQNLNAQENILRALTDANARFASLRQAITQQSAQREGMIQDLILCFEKYEELLGKSKKGQDYYSRLKEAVTKTLDRCRSECKVRQEERDMIASKYAPKVPPPSRPTAPKPGQPGTPTTPTPASTPVMTPPLADSPQLPPGMAAPPPVGPSGSAALPPSFEGPKLKDFLPFMKPQSFGPKASSPSRQVLPPASPDPSLSGPPSLASSSASDSPQHRTLTHMPPDAAFGPQQLAAGPQGYRGAGPHATVSGSTPDVASAGQMPSARTTIADIRQPSGAPPPDVTANLPGDPGPSATARQPARRVIPVSHQGRLLFPSTPLGLSARGLWRRHACGRKRSARQRGFGVTLRFGILGVLPAGSDAARTASLPCAASVCSHQHCAERSSCLVADHGSASWDAAASSAPSSHVRPARRLTAVSSELRDPEPASHDETFTQSVSCLIIPLPFAGSVWLSTAPAERVQSVGAFPSPPPGPVRFTETRDPSPAGTAASNPAVPAASAAVPAARPATVLPSRGCADTTCRQGSSNTSRCILQPSSYLVVFQFRRGLMTQSAWPASMRLIPCMSTTSPVREWMPGPCSQPSSQLPSANTATSSVAGVAFGQQSYPLPSSSMPAPFSTTAPVPSGQAQSGVNVVTAGPHPPTSQYQSQKPAQQQLPPPVPGMMPQSHLPMSMPSQQQLPLPAHSHLPPTSTQSAHPVSQQQPFQQQPHGYAQLNQNASHVQGQVSGPGVGMPQGQVSGPGVGMPQGQVSGPGVGMPQGQGAVPGQGQSVGQFMPGAQTMGAFSSAVPSSQALTRPQQQQTLQYPQTFQTPHLQQPRPPVSSGYHPGYSQGAQNFGAVPATSSMVPQTMASIITAQAGQVPATSGQLFPGQQQGYPPGSRPQQFSQQQQFPQQQKQPQPFPPQQQMSYPHAQSSQQQVSSQKQQQQFHQQRHPFPQQQYLSQQQQQQQSYPQQPFSQQNQPLPQQHQPFRSHPPPPHQQHPQQVLPPQPHQMQGHQIRPQGAQHSLPGQQPQQQQPQYPQYSSQQTQPQIPPESQLIFPTPLQPSRVPPVQPPTPTSQPGVSGQGTGTHHPLTPQGPDMPPLPPSTQQAHSSLPATPQPQPSGSNVTAAAAAAPSQSGSLSGPNLSRQESSLDELLSSSPEGSKHAPIPAPIITPKVLTDQEKQQQKEEAMKKGAIVETVKDPYANSSVLNKLVSDVEAFGKFVDDLSISILGVSRLDTVWKSLIDSQDHDVKKQSIAIARCYPMKNREPDIMPYDETRVVLSTTKDDYINASWINDLAPSCPKFVATQAPLTVTMTDFWAMVYELGSEVIVQITSEYETSKKFPVYFPTEKGQQMEQGPMIVNLQSVKYRQLWTERNIYLKHSQTKQGRTVIHLQFKTWPVSGFPEEVPHIIRFISEVHSFYQQQRSLLKPVIVHCGNGVGRTGAFLMIYTGMQEMLHGNGLIDVPALAKRMLQKRKNLIHKKEQLKFCYDALLCFAEDFLKKRNILVQHPHFEKKTKIVEPASSTASSDDIVLGSVNLHTLQQTVGRLHVHADSAGGGEKTSVPTPPTDQPTTGTKDPAQPISTLPDLIQQQSRSDATMGSGGASSSCAGGGGGLASGVALSHASSAVDGARADSTKTHSRSGSNASQQSLPSLTESGSSRASPQHGPPPPSSSSFSHSPSPSSSSVGGGGGGGGVSQSLADLQDPTKFTLGKGEQKKRFTKASFDRKGSGAGLDLKTDPADPLSSLDAMWSIHKPGQSEK